MSEYHFGSGILVGTPLTTYNGTAITLPSPIQFGALQDVSIDLSFDVKELYGQNQFPLAVGRGKAKITGKAKQAQFNAMLFNDLFFGQTRVSGVYSDYIDTIGTAIPTTPFTITPVTTYAAQLVGTTPAFGFDLGVRSANGIPMTRVSGTPSTGQYALTGGVYTFASADASLVVFISFSYTATATAGIAAQQYSTVQNVLMGQAPTFQADFVTVYQQKTLKMTLYSCVASKLSFATKLDDFTIPEFDFSAYANSSGNVIKWQTTDF